MIFSTSTADSLLREYNIRPPSVELIFKVETIIVTPDEMDEIYPPSTIDADSDMNVPTSGPTLFDLDLFTYCSRTS